MNSRLYLTLLLQLFILFISWTADMSIFAFGSSKKSDSIYSSPKRTTSVKLLLTNSDTELAKKKIEIWKPKEKFWTDDYDNMVEKYMNDLKNSKGKSKLKALYTLDYYLKPDAFDSLVQKKEIARGSFGAVFNVGHPNYVEKYAYDRQNAPYFVKENKMGIYASYFNPNLFVKYFGQFGPHGRSIFMEKCETDLRDQMSAIAEMDKSDVNHPKEIRKVLQALTEFLPEVLQELRKLGIVHGDIKPENIMICNGSLKLGDFDSAVFTSEIEKDPSKQRKVSDAMLSPLVKNDKPDPNRDLYAAGKTILDILRSTQNSIDYNLKFPEPTRFNEIYLMLRIYFIIRNIREDILPKDDKIRRVLKKLLYQYLVKWQNGLSD